MIQIPIVDGRPVTGTTADNTSESTVGTDKLGKDTFLQLLVAQLKYQDPLEPSSNDEFLGELAQFSTLEELQNLSATINNSNALSLVGKNVILEVGDAKIGGYVQYVSMVNGKAHLAINGELYSAEYLHEVIDDKYLAALLEAEKNNGNSGKGEDNTNTGDVKGDSGEAD